MTTAYTSLLGLALPVTGELSGTWGDVVNNSITSLLDSAVAGTTNVSTDGDVTLTTTTGAANTAREAILLFSGARTALRTVTAPAQSKIYTVINATTGGYSVKLVGSGPTTGLTIPNGASAVVAWNGSDFVEVGTSSIGNLTVNGNLTVTGTSTLTGAVTAQGLTVGKGGSAVSTNTALGLSALAAITSGANNTSVGYLALTTNITGSNNSAFGLYALRLNTGSNNSAFGVQALDVNTGSSNIAFGGGALASNTTASQNTAVGYQAAYSNTTGGDNTAVGQTSLYTNTTGSYNTAIGLASLNRNTTANNNTAVGYTSLYYNTTGAANVAVGRDALISNTTASNNTALGYRAGYVNTVGGENLYLGYYAGYNATGDFSCFVGPEAGYYTTGSYNTFLGVSSGAAVTTGTKNTILGRYSGNQGGLDIRTSSGYVVLSDGDGNPVFKAQTTATWALEGANVVSGTGITFPATQNSSSDANTLDDYEEGTWTPNIAFGGNTTGITYNATYNKGWYTKVGNVVVCKMACEVSNTGSATGDLTVTNFPFNSSQVTASASYAISVNGVTTSTQVFLYGTLISGSIAVAKLVSGGSQSFIGKSDCATSISILGSIVYMV